jgi:hypothetical protein
MSLQRRARQLERRSSEELSMADKKVLAILSRVQKIFPHPLWGIGVATLLAIVGRGELLIRSAGLVLAVIWLAIGLWVYVLKEHWKYRYIIGSALTSLMLLVSMGLMYWWLVGKLKDQLADVYQHLEISYVNSSESSNDPMGTIFTITNKSSNEISRKHELMCFTRSALGTRNGLKWAVEQLTSVIRKGQMALIPATHIPPPFLIGPHELEDAPIEPGGDAQSDQCLAWFRFSSTECADVTIGFWYTLESQPDIEQEISKRWYAYKDQSGKFNWVPQPTGAYTDYCNAPRPGS